MASLSRVQSLLALADEDLIGARTLLGVNTRMARYHVQQCGEKAVKALLEHRDIDPGREHRFNMLAEKLPKDDPWRARINGLDALSPAATSHRYPTSSGRIIPAPSRAAVESEIATVEQLLKDVKAAVAEPVPKTAKPEEKPSEHERKLALAKKLISIARLREFSLPDNVEENLVIYADERSLSEMVKEIQSASSFQDVLDAHSVVLPKNENT